MISWDDFVKVEMRVGTIIKAVDFPEARKSAFKLKIDLGELGTRWSSAQITDLYTIDELIGKQVIVVVNFPKKQIANFMSECLVLGSVNDRKQVTLLTPDHVVANGDRIS